VSNVLAYEKRLDVLGSLVGGAGMRRTAERTGVHRDTIGRFAFAMGVGCQRLHDAVVRNVAAHFVDLDEQHSWTRKRQVNVNPERDDVRVIGERWTWASICRSSKLTIAWHVGKRTAESADALVADTRARLCVMPQLTTDGLDLYVEPIGRHFGYGVDYAQMVKRPREGGGKFLEKRIIFGAPDLAKTTTYAIERSNLTNRTWNARLIRRTLCFSKDVDRHDASIALAYVYRNLCHVPERQKETAGMAANVTDHIWDLEELMVAALEAADVGKPQPRPLTFRVPTTTARELPAGRGYMRVVPSGGGAAAPSTTPAPTTPAAPAVPVAPVEPSGQLDLLSWCPGPAKVLPPKGAQLDLFSSELPFI
jgi:IS1 family transposase